MDDEKIKEVVYKLLDYVGLTGISRVRAYGKITDALNKELNKIKDQDNANN